MQGNRYSHGRLAFDQVANRAGELDIGMVEARRRKRIVLQQELVSLSDQSTELVGYEIAAIMCIQKKEGWLQHANHGGLHQRQNVERYS